MERNDIVTRYKAYEAALRREGWVDYPNLLVRLTIRARDDRPSLAAFLEQYDHVLVDEYPHISSSRLEHSSTVLPDHLIMASYSSESA